MVGLVGAPAHILLNRKDDAASHSTRKQTSVSGAAFNSYSFGPMDLPDGENKAGVEGGKKAAAGSTATTKSINGGVAGFLTHLAASQHVK
jgi:hypothetical protein